MPSARLWWVIGLSVGLLWAAALLAAFLYYRQSQDEAQVIVPTLKVLSLPTDPATPTFTLPTLTPTERPSLPAVWTATLTFTPSQTWTPSLTQTATSSRTPTLTPTPLPTDTPIPAGTPTPTFWPTINPTLFIHTYWEGNGDGSVMEDYQRGGKYLRHFDLPVRVYWDDWASPIWTRMIIDAISLINGVVPIERTFTEADSTMRVYIVDSLSEYEANCPVGTAACATIALQSEASDGQYAEVRGWVWIWASAPPDTSMVIHEMMHAMGVMVHSPYSDDVMFATYTQLPDGVRFSARDLLILQLLYALPPLGGEFAPPNIQPR